jgi:hypothetical protein
MKTTIENPRTPQLDGQAQGTAPQLDGQAQGTAPQLDGQAQGTAPQLDGQAQGTAPTFSSTYSYLLWLFGVNRLCIR